MERWEARYGMFPCGPKAQHSSLRLHLSFVSLYAALVIVQEKWEKGWILRISVVQTGIAEWEAGAKGLRFLSLRTRGPSKQAKAWVLSQCRMEYGSGLHLTPALRYSDILNVENAWLVSYVPSLSSDLYSRIRVASPSWGFGRVPQGLMGTEYKVYDWHLLPWMGYQLLLFSLSLSLLLLLCCHSWLILKHPRPGYWGVTHVWESESQGGVSAAHDLEKVILFFMASGSTFLYNYRKSVCYPSPYFVGDSIALSHGVHWSRQWRR